MPSSCPSLSEAISRIGRRVASSVTRARIKPVVVCAHCNNEWMKRLEDAVIPILTPMMLGHALVLDEPALAALGAWVTKTALVFELVQRDSDATASAADRLWFKNHRVPLAGSRIWAARYVGTFGNSWQARSTLFTYDLDDPTSVPSPHGLVAVLAYGEVAFRVAMVRSAPALPTRLRSHRVIARADDLAGDGPAQLATGQSTRRRRFARLRWPARSNDRTGRARPHRTATGTLTKHETCGAATNPVVRTQAQEGGTMAMSTAVGGTR